MFKIELVQGSVSAAHFSAVYVPEQRLIIEPDLVPNYLLPVHFVAHKASTLPCFWLRLAPQ